MSYIGTEPKDVRSFGRAKFDYTASQGQTAFTGADDDSKTLAFTDGQIEVFVNGILMDESDFSTSNGNTVTLASAANLNDIVSITALQTDIPNSDYVPATGGTFSGDVDFGSNKITYANLYNNLSDLPSASTYHGMFAHVHNTGLAYYSHAGAWIPLANTTGATFSGNIVASDGINLGGTGSANKLSDFETGTFIPTLLCDNNGSLALNTTSDTCSYVKIGALVHCQGSIAFTGSGATGNFRLGSFPFTMDTALAEQAELSPATINLYNMAIAISNLPNGEMSNVSGNPTLLIRDNGGNTSGVQACANHFGGATTLRFAVQYRTDQ